MMQRYAHVVMTVVGIIAVVVGILWTTGSLEGFAGQSTVMVAPCNGGAGITVRGSANAKNGADNVVGQLRREQQCWILTIPPRTMVTMTNPTARLDKSPDAQQKRQRGNPNNDYRPLERNFRVQWRHTNTANAPIKVRQRNPIANTDDNALLIAEQL